MWRSWWRIRLISGRSKVQLLSSGLARSSIGRAPDSDSGCCRFESCRACCGHCIMAVPQTVDLKVRVRFPLVTPYCRRLTDKPPHYGCGTGGSNPLGSAICIAQRMRALPSEGRGRGFPLRGLRAPLGRSPTTDICPYRQTGQGTGPLNPHGEGSSPSTDAMLL